MYIPMFWIERAGEIAAALLAIAGLAALIRNKIVRPLGQRWDRLQEIFEQLLAAAKFIREVSQEMREFSGAFTLFAVSIKEQVDHNTGRIERLEDMRELVIDIQADVARIERHRGGRREAD